MDLRRGGDGGGDVEVAIFFFFQKKRQREKGVCAKLEDLGDSFLNSGARCWWRGTKKKLFFKM